jgi:putative methionine-R-sulfoxide reductase with GAF domain
VNGDGVGGFPLERLQDLLLERRDLTEFLDEFTRLMAESLAQGQEGVWCAVTLLRGKSASTVASSSDRAAALDEIQYGFGDGPCLTAAREHTLVHVPDMRREFRWPEYQEAAAANGIISVLGVPFELEGEASAGLDVYSDEPNKYDHAAIRNVQRHVLMASKALRLAVRFAQHQDTEAHLESAMQSRTTIDLAVGIIMAQNSCSQDQAFNILKSASNNRNVKLRDLAAQVIATVHQGPTQTHFDR